MLKRIQLVALGAAVLLAAGTANARGVGGPGGGAGGPGFKRSEAAPPATITATTPIARTAASAVQPGGDVTADGWQFVGGEAGWAAPQHRYDFQGGRVVHAHQAWCVASHDVPAPAKSSLSEQERNLYRGA